MLLVSELVGKLKKKNAARVAQYDRQCGKKKKKKVVRSIAKVVFLVSISSKKIFTLERKNILYQQRPAVSVKVFSLTSTHPQLFSTASIPLYL